MSERLRDIAHWYLIYTHPKQEDRVSNNLTSWGVQTFNPKLMDRRVNRFTNEMVYVAKPLFSRYVFAWFSVSQHFHKINYTRGVHSIVSFGNGPAPVDDEIVEYIRSRLGQDGFVKCNECLKPGDRVQITHGMMESLSGIFEHEVKDSGRVMILLSAIKYQARVEIDKQFLVLQERDCDKR